MEHPLKFLSKLELKRNHSSISILSYCGEHEIPSSPGVYLLIAKRVRFLYPAGRNSIYYIGQTSSLHKRIVKQHYKWHSHVKHGCRLGDYLYEARHEYGGVYGGRYCFIPTWPGMSQQKLEKKVIREFILQYHAPPVANGAGVWGWVKKPSLRNSN